MSVDFPNEAALCQRFCPREHKVVSVPDSNADLSVAADELQPMPLADPGAPAGISKWKEPVLGHERINLGASGAAFAGLKRSSLEPVLAIWGEVREVGAASARHIRRFRAVAQLGRAPGSGPGGRGFKSHQPDI